MNLKRRAVFRYPIEPAPRTAVLADWFREPGIISKSRAVRIFPHGWCEEAARFSPGAIAATRDRLLALAAGVSPPLTHALIALERAGDPMLSAADRDRLWRAFRVPVFEQIIGPRGELLAAECEAHDGLHIETPGHVWDGYAIEMSLCACGRKTPRLASAEPVERARSAAAYAR
jgi:hypothetical protein